MPKATPKLQEPFKSLVPMLVDAIPPAIQKLKLTEAVIAVRLHYHSTDAPPGHYCVWVRVLTEPARAHVIKGNEPKNVPFALWHSTAGASNGHPGKDVGLYEADVANPKLLAQFAKIYELLEKSEDKYMPQLQETMRQVSVQLNERDWSKNTKVSDDFVVFPADGSNFFGGEYEPDMAASVSDEKLELLRKRKWINW